MADLTVKGVIFDLDGTLVTSSLDFALIKAQVGCDRDADLLDFVESLPSPYMREEAMALIHQHEMQDAQHAELIPGVVDTVSFFKSIGIPMAIVTRNYSKAAQLKLERCGLELDYMLTREDALPKPDPQALHMVADSWSLPYQHCVYVGDYKYDIEAAQRASMHACLFAPVGLPDYAQQADIIIERFVDLPVALGLHHRSRTGQFA
ncbi:HAD family hydrolase [Pseudoalteromonas ardens]|uniref:Phosphatase n=1 Tax=Pseudoalteromonas rubra TaxID=43658 RepID=A0A0L0ENJ0_9GAMM|nr:HAD-IA family hydrolase [Pseudoalteromonas sp. R96]KNC65979.1 phosphatase [Pseudoalteromonas rubra]MDK1310174.1 HAD-IA family hydrolase [Pseudoalteromonas sp. R96]